MKKIELSEKSKVNLVEAILDSQVAYAYGETWNYDDGKVRPIRDEVLVRDIDNYLKRLLELGEVMHYSDQEELYSQEEKVGRQIAHCLRGDHYTDAKKVLAIKAAMWFESRSCYFDGEEGDIGVGLRKKEAKRQFMENQHDSWDED